MNNHVVSQLHFGAEFQPIINIENDTTFAYEALARFWYENKKITPAIVFEALHEDLILLCEVENRLTEFQLKSAPQSKTVFVNYDPHAAAFNTKQLNEILQNHGSRQDIVFEIIEDTHELSEEKRDELLLFLQNHSIKIAVDDFGKYNSFFSFELISACQFLKFDRHWFRKSTYNIPEFDLLQAFIRYAHEKGKKTIVEGIETLDDLLCAKRLGTDFVQGFLFRPDFIEVRSRSEPIHITSRRPFELTYY